MTIYSLLAIYTWVLIEGAYLHSLVLTAFHNGGGVTKMKYFAPFGWLFPLVITIIWITGNVKFRHPESICWDSNMGMVLIHFLVKTLIKLFFNHLLS